MIPSSFRINTSLITKLILSFIHAHQSFSEKFQQEQICNNNNDLNTCTAWSSSPVLEEQRNRIDKSANKNFELPNDFIDPCQDEGPLCHVWAIEGECSHNPHFMLSSCAKSCGTCQPLPRGSQTLVDEETNDTVICYDKHPGTECSKWAAEGECWINPAFMHLNCKYSCWECVDRNRDKMLGIPNEERQRKIIYATINTGSQQLIRDTSEDDPKSISAEDREKVILTIQQMERYAKYGMTNFSVDTQTRQRCRNEFRMCAEWASRGLCTSIPDDPGKLSSNHRNPTRSDILFMMNMCPLACGTCHLLQLFHKCAGRRHPFAQPSFGSSEDLRSFFTEKTRTANGGDIRGDNCTYQPMLTSYSNQVEDDDVQLKNHSHVVLYQSFLSDEEADHLVLLGSTIGNSTPTIAQPTTLRDDTGTKINNSLYYASCHRGDCETDVIYRQIRSRIASLSDSITVDHLEPMSFIHSKNPQESLQHDFELSSSWKPAGPRILSILLFLSAPFNDHGGRRGQEGGIGFPKLDWLHIRPQKGMAVVWSNVKADDFFAPDFSTSYEYMPLQEGLGSILMSTVHVTLYNWTDAKARGCA